MPGGWDPGWDPPNFLGLLPARGANNKRSRESIFLLPPFLACKSNDGRDKKTSLDRARAENCAFTDEALQTRAALFPLPLPFSKLLS